MITYGTIPTSTTTTPRPPPISVDPRFVSLAKERIKSSLNTRRPWTEMFLFPAFSLPATLGQALHRIGPNIMYYRMNYVIVVLTFVFLGLLWEPASMIFFIGIMFAWLYLYFLREDTLVVYGHEVNDRVVTLVLSVLTILGLVVTNAKNNMSVSLFVGAVAVLVHTAFREGEGEVVENGSKDGAVTLPLKQPASSSSTE